jgi:hypothetical protein
VKELKLNPNTHNNNFKIILLEPLVRTLHSKDTDERYNIAYSTKGDKGIEEHNHYNLLPDKVNTMTYAMFYAVYIKGGRVDLLENVILIFDEINSLTQPNDIKKVFNAIRGYLKSKRIIMICMTAYLDEYIGKFLNEHLEPINIKIKVLNKGYEHVNTYISNINVLKNIENITNGNINKLILSTNSIKDLISLNTFYPESIFQVISGDTFNDNFKQFVQKNPSISISNIKFVSDCSEIDVNQSIVYTSTMQNGADLYVQGCSLNKVIVVNNSCIISNNEINQSIGRVRDKELIESIYVIERPFHRGKPDVYNCAKYSEIIDENYSVRLNDKQAVPIYFDSNNKKFEYHYRTLKYVLQSECIGTTNIVWERQTDGSMCLSKKVFEYLKYLTLKRLYPKNCGDTWDGATSEYLENTLWKDCQVSIDFKGLLESITALLNEDIFTSDVQSSEEIENDVISGCKKAEVEKEVKKQMYEKLDKRCEVRFYMGLVFFLNGGEIPIIYRDVGY